MCIWKAKLRTVLGLLGQAEREKRLIRTGETDRMWFFCQDTTGRGAGGAGQVVCLQI
jgi:hypothetical protein